MFIVATRVTLKPNTAIQCAELFQKTNPNLVQDQDDWVGAQMIYDEARNEVTVLAKWKNADAYQQFSQSSSFQTTMQQFVAFFASKPEVSINHVLVDM